MAEEKPIHFYLKGNKSIRCLSTDVWAKKTVKVEEVTCHECKRLLATDGLKVEKSDEGFTFGKAKGETLIRFIKEAKTVHGWVTGDEDGVYFKIAKSEAIKMVTKNYTLVFKFHFENSELYLN